MNLQEHVTHLRALGSRLFNENVRLANVKTAKERIMREVWVNQIRKEILDAKALLSTQYPDYDPKADEMTDDELLAELEA